MTASLNLAERIELVLAAACLGDALGAPPEAMHPAEILSVFGGRITGFVPAPPLAPFSNGAAPGSLTDDATQLLAMASAIIAAGGTPTIHDAAKALIAWADDPRGFGKFAGPSTQAAIDRMRAGEDPGLVATPARYSIAMGTTNGAAMAGAGRGLHPSGRSRRGRRCRRDPVGADAQHADRLCRRRGGRGRRGDRPCRWNDCERHAALTRRGGLCRRRGRREAGGNARTARSGR